MTTGLLEKEKSEEGSLRRRWPFEDFPSLFEEMDRFWGPSLFRPRFLFPFSSIWRSWTPGIDMFEKGDQLVIQADLPGLKKDEVEVTLQEGRLTISGERKSETKVEKENYYQLERSRGSFSRTILLPFDTTAEEVRADFKDGVLEIRVPKPPELKEKRQKIQIR